MNIQFYLEKLQGFAEFRKFIKKNPSAYLCSGFFSIDKEGKDNQQHLDYYVPDSKKMFSFQLEDEIKLIPAQIFDGYVPSKLLVNNDVDFDDIEKLIMEKIKQENIQNKLQKILLSLQNKDDSDFFISTIFISGFGMLKLNIDISKMEVVLFEKKSFFDIMKIFKRDE
ncbi:MAG: hypothetical protein KJ646_03080 [Nanoarchaeota archaeon]|nr:hypothetical protein [Candidatus Woesearchaeota archaeon]MBU4069941.1 hypothetical protein [Nanoarchaeota archaeon]MBU4117108.1 hypothetical protein [Nanoarchaeota archaeon]